MKYTTFTAFLKEFNRTTLADFTGFDGTEKVSKTPIYEHPVESLTIWHWTSADGLEGFIRDDSAGISTLCLNNSRDDHLTLAAWNADFDIRVLADYLDDDDLKLALEDAKKNLWGFNDDVNLWDD
jgi:hypothetical protein